MCDQTVDHGWLSCGLCHAQSIADVELCKQLLVHMPQAGRPKLLPRRTPLLGTRRFVPPESLGLIDNWAKSVPGSWGRSDHSLGLLRGEVVGQPLPFPDHGHSMGGRIYTIKSIRRVPVGAMGQASQGGLGSRSVAEMPYFRNPDVAAVYWGRVCPVSAAALCQHDLRYEFLLPVLRNAGVGSYGGRDADLHPVKQSDGRAGRGNRSLNGSV